MRLTSEFWVSALARKVSQDGNYMTVIHKGHASAGAICIQVLYRDGGYALFGPVPMGNYEKEQMDRCFQQVFEHPTDQAAIESYVNKQIQFDEDLWVLEMECNNPEQYLTIHPK